MNPDSPARRLHRDIQNHEIWPAGNSHRQGSTWIREALLRRTGPSELLCTWTTGGPTEPWEGNFTVIRRSRDNGSSWEEFGEFRHPIRGLFTTELFVPRPGEIHAFLNTYGNGTWMTQLGSYRAISRDGGQTWTGPHSLPGGIANVWPNRGIRHSSGRWIIPVSWAELRGSEWMEPFTGRPPSPGKVGHLTFEPSILPIGSEVGARYQRGNAWADANHRYACGVMLSDDDGETFRLRGYLRGGRHGHLIEPRVVELGNGDLAMLIRSQRDGRLWQSHSSDGGETWADPNRSAIPNPGAKVNLLRGNDGRIFLIHNPVDVSDLAYGCRNPLSLWISSDDLKSWDLQTDLIRDENPDACLNYPDGFIDEEARQIVLCWEDVFRVYLMRIPFEIGRHSL